VAEKIINKLVDDDYINEERFARNYAGSKFRIKKWGKNRIIYEMKRKCIPDLIVQIGLEEIVGTDTPFSELLQTIDSLDFKEVGLTELLPELARLKSKLPPELLHEDCILEGPPAKLEALKDEVKELLIGRLMHYGSKS